jgi:hypothetical protein
MNPAHIPLLALKHISEFSPQAYLEYLRGLWIDPATTKKATTKKPKRYLTGTVTKKGTLSIRCNRHPKEVTRAEVEELRVSVGLSHLQVWSALRKRSIKVVNKITKVSIKVETSPASASQTSPQNTPLSQ